ncbi:MAG: hypothetical protein AB7R89_28345 [Dehalococcoidia bacterium]
MRVLGFCLEQSSLVTWGPIGGYECSCEPKHAFRENDDGTVSPVERGDEAFWFADAGFRAEVYRFPGEAHLQQIAAASEEAR